MQCHGAPYFASNLLAIYFAIFIFSLQNLNSLTWSFKNKLIFTCSYTVLCRTRESSTGIPQSFSMCYETTSHERESKVVDGQRKRKELIVNALLLAGFSPLLI
uniref:Uncharacterized protein n=1 Tax=Parascaris univalens TaxID=6257 RepID=A0A915B432_PARUN